MHAKVRKGMLAGALLWGLSLCATPASASLLYTTLGPANEYDTSNGYYIDGSNFTNQVIAAEFSPTASTSFWTATLALGNFAGNNTPINLYLESDNGGLPSGTVLASMSQNGTIPAFVSGGGLITFDCTSAGCGISSGTTYWLVAQEPDANSQQVWLWAYLDQGGHGAYNVSGGVTSFNGYDSTIVGFRVDTAAGTATPEPGSMLLLGTGMVGLAGILRRRRA